ncbi:hypothetical protein [Halalkalibacter okhensis]|uniref:Uncharacterized protein n=1 Tax=Halalkalibacter okhensis TaxID=333138 RepID=A0A0B0ICF1_9BACI|nr:hypothetical protein [Halalkalibacter okhensis]KHF38567.1 hypothetical protein LQ50_20700 [Halalkalibacter okhensis]
MKNQFDNSLKELYDDISWAESRKKLVEEKINAQIKDSLKKTKKSPSMIYATSIVVSIFIMFVGIQFILSDNYLGEPRGNGTSYSNDEEDEKSENVNSYSEDLSEEEQFVGPDKDEANHEILSGHSTMNGYVMYGWEHDNFNLENLKASMEYRIPNIQKAIDATDNFYLKKDFEVIQELLFELNENMDNEEKRDHLVL